jgi:hypothetical protein
VLEGDEELPGEIAAVERAFGAENRRRILTSYLGQAGPVTPANAWQHVYRILLWINPTIGLAHCYESDKCQPHKAWYPRSLAFHAWVAEQLGVSPGDLREHIDRLFHAALPTLAHVEASARRSAGRKHLEPYAGMDMPLPGDDPELVDIVTTALGIDPVLVPDVAARTLVELVYTHFSLENKRKNLLGRGFEDTLAALICQLEGHERWEIATRVDIGAIPGFLSHGAQLKRTEVDLALWERDGDRRILVSSKWSVRADRERQFDSDFEDYSKANAGSPFEYILLTNEFDAARLDASCGKVRGNQHLFTKVVHVQPEAVLVAYGREADMPAPGATTRRKARLLRGHLESGRMVPLAKWLQDLVG